MEGSAKGVDLVHVRPSRTRSFASLANGQTGCPDGSNGSSTTGTWKWSAPALLIVLADGCKLLALRSSLRLPFLELACPAQVGKIQYEEGSAGVVGDGRAADVENRGDGDLLVTGTTDTPSFARFPPLFPPPQSCPPTQSPTLGHTAPGSAPFPSSITASLLYCQSQAHPRKPVSGQQVTGSCRVGLAIR